MRLLLLTLPLVLACKGGKDGDTDPSDDTDKTPDTGGPTDDETWEDLSFQTLDLLLPATVYRARTARLFTDAASFQTFTTLTPPPELAAGTHHVLVRVGNPGAYPGSVPAFTKVEKSESGRLSADLTWQIPDDDCVNFVVTVPQAAFALIPPQPGARPKFGVGWEDNNSYDCTDGKTVGQSCSVREYCGPDLFCQGITRAGTGTCQPTALKNSWYLPATTLEDNAVTTVPVEVSGLGSNDTDVLLLVRLNHPRAADLRITVESPSGREVTVVDGVALPRTGQVSSALRGFSGQETVNGTWKVRFYDQQAGQRGSLDEGSILEIGSTAGP